MKQTVLVASFALLFPITFAEQPKVDLDSLGWFAGCWEARYATGRIVSENWMKPLGNTMMGVSRTVRDGKTTLYEYIRLVQSDDGSVQYVVHPSGQKEVAFTLVSREKNVAVFENREHDFPQRIIYRRVTADSLFARIEGTLRGEQRGSDFPFRRVACE